MQTENNYWSMDRCLDLISRATTSSYSIQNHQLINQLVVQKNRGDPNALYGYAHLLRDYNGVSELFNLSYEEIEATFFKIFWDLSEQDHPHACNDMVKFDNSYIFARIHISKEDLLIKKQHCAKIAVENNFSFYMHYANVFLFGLNDEHASDLMLKDSPYLDEEHKELVAQSIALYEKAAREMGYANCFARIVEAYHQGIGVEQNTTTAAAWAKLIKERVTYQSVYKNVNWVKAIYPVFEYPSIQESEEFKTLYAQLQKLPQW